MNVGDIKEHKTVNAKTGKVTITTSVVTQEEVDAYNSQLQAQEQAEAERITNLPETKIAQLEGVVSQQEELIAILLLEGVSV